MKTKQCETCKNEACSFKPYTCNGETRCANYRKGSQIDYLKRYQAWRTGKDERTMAEAKLSPCETTKTIDWAIKELSR